MKDKPASQVDTTKGIPLSNMSHESVLIDVSNLRKKIEDLESEKVKLLEEIEARKEYIELMEKAYNRAFSMAYAHHYRESQEDINKGEALRNKIKSF